MNQNRYMQFFFDFLDEFMFDRHALGSKSTREFYVIRYYDQRRRLLGT